LERRKEFPLHGSDTPVTLLPPEPSPPQPHPQFREEDPTPRGHTLFSPPPPTFLTLKTPPPPPVPPWLILPPWFFFPILAAQFASFFFLGGERSRTREHQSSFPPLFSLPFVCRNCGGSAEAYFFSSLFSFHTTAAGHSCSGPFSFFSFSSLTDRGAFAKLDAFLLFFAQDHKAMRPSSPSPFPLLNTPQRYSFPPFFLLYTVNT